MATQQIVGRQINSGGVNGTLLSSGNNVVILKYNLAATTAPAAGNDNTEGYAQGSIWLDTTAKRIYILENPATAAAVWKSVGTTSWSQVIGITGTANSTTFLRGDGVYSNALTGSLSIATSLDFTSTTTVTGASTQIVPLSTGLGINVPTSKDIRLSVNGSAVVTLSASSFSLGSTNGITFTSTTGTVTGTSRQITGTSLGIAYNVPAGLKHLYSVGGTSYGFMGAPSGGGGTQVAFGELAGAAISTSNNMIAIGGYTLASGVSTPGSEQMAIGSGALRYAQATSSANIAIGVNAGNASTTLSGNVVIGNSAWQTGVGTGTNNVIVGNAAYLNATSGSSNTVLGRGAWGGGIATGSQNFVGGRDAAFNCTAISNSVVIGYQAQGSAVGTGTGGVYIGYRAGYAVTSGAYNIILGFDNSSITTGGNNIMIGNAVTVGSVTGDYQINIGNSYRRDTAGVITLRHGTTSMTDIYTTSTTALTLGSAIGLVFGATGTVVAASRGAWGTSNGVSINTPTGTDIRLLVQNAAVATLSGTALTLGTSVALVVPTNTTPASAAAAGTAGTIAWDANYVYVCTATNTWKRAAIATW